MYQLSWSMAISWVPDGAQSMTVPTAQTIAVNMATGTAPGPILVPGLNAPSAANITTACNAAATAAAAQFETATNLAIIQGFATGGD